MITDLHNIYRPEEMQRTNSAISRSGGRPRSGAAVARRRKAASAKLVGKEVAEAL